MRGLSDAEREALSMILARRAAGQEGNPATRQPMRLDPRALDQLAVDGRTKRWIEGPYRVNQITELGELALRVDAARRDAGL